MTPEERVAAAIKPLLSADFSSVDSVALVAAMCQAVREAEKAGYSAGYEQGGGSGYFDWERALEDDLEPGIYVDGPVEAVAEIKKRLAAARLEALEEAAKIVEEFDVPMIKLAAKYGPSFPTSKPYADAIRERAKA